MAKIYFRHLVVLLCGASSLNVASCKLFLDDYTFENNDGGEDTDSETESSSESNADLDSDGTTSTDLDTNPGDHSGGNTDSDSDRDTSSDAYTVIENDSDANPKTDDGEDTDTETETNIDTATSTESIAATDTDPDVDSDTGTETDSLADSTVIDTETGGDSDTADSDADSDGDSESDLDTNTDLDVDTDRCVVSCDDYNSCTVDEILFVNANCEPTCSNEPVTSCTSSDDCCPSGCHANNDNDCSPVCGNGEMETGETCDPPSSCLPECDDGNVCTSGRVISGNASTCDLVCSQSPTDCSCTVENGCIGDVAGTLLIAGLVTDKVNNPNYTHDMGFATYHGGADSNESTGAMAYCAVDVTTTFKLSNPTTLGKISLIAEVGGGGQGGGYSMSVLVVNSDGMETIVYSDAWSDMGGDTTSVNITVDNNAPWIDIVRVEVLLSGSGSASPAYDECVSYARHYETTIFGYNE